MATYQVNWNYRPADEGLIASVNPSGVKPIVKFFDACYNTNKSGWSPTAAQDGNGYYDLTNFDIVDANWNVTISSVKANGTTSPISNLSGNYGVYANSIGSKSGKLRSQWLLEKDYDTNGIVEGVEYGIAYPRYIDEYVKLPTEYQTEFNTATWVVNGVPYVACNYYHSQLGKAFSLDNIRLRFTGHTYEGHDVDSIARYNGAFNLNTWRTNDWIHIVGEDGSYYDRVDMYTGSWYVYYNRLGPVSRQSSSTRSLFSNFTGYSFDPTVKKTFYSNSAEDNIVKEYGNAITIDGHTYTTGSYPYVDVTGTGAYAKQIGIDCYRKTSVVLKNATVVTTYNNVETTTVVGDIVQEVFSDTGIFTINGIKLFVNKGWGINAASDSTAFRIKTSTGTIGTSFTLIEVNWY